MSVPKSFRLSDFSNACLEEIADRQGKTQTQVIEELIKGFVIFDMKPEESIEVMQAAEKRIGNLKSNGK